MATNKAAAKKTTTPNPPRRRPGSLTDQLDQLEVGQSVSVSNRFEIGDESTNDKAIKDSAQNARATLTSYVARICEDEFDDRKYVVESGVFVNDAKTALLVSAVATRLA